MIFVNNKKKPPIKAALFVHEIFEKIGQHR